MHDHSIKSLFVIAATWVAHPSMAQQLDLSQPQVRGDYYIVTPESFSAGDVECFEQAIDAVAAQYGARLDVEYTRLPQIERDHYSYFELSALTAEGHRFHVGFSEEGFGVVTRHVYDFDPTDLHSLYYYNDGENSVTTHTFQASELRYILSDRGIEFPNIQGDLSPDEIISDIAAHQKLLDAINNCTPKLG